MHSNKHPQSGKYFRITIDNFNAADSDGQAGYDKMLHGSKIRLVDWADRMELDETLTVRQIRVAREFYAHRCLPDLDNPIAQGFDMSGLVYGMRETEFQGQRRAIAVVLGEHELIEERGS